MTEIRSKHAVQTALDRLTQSVGSAYTTPPLVVGIHTGGVWVAESLCQRLQWPAPASLDIALYRDDFQTSGLRRSGVTGGLPTQLDGDTILLVDDVLYTGRTIRAALNELFDYGRPRSISLAILFDRGGRELPIEPQFLGEALGQDGAGRCKLTGPEPLVLVTPDIQ
jgi:pyrimidine operon attenuation protein/uracil phosphoribosyltransferase